MPRGYRCIILAAVGWLILAAVPAKAPPDQGKAADTEQRIANSLDAIARAQGEAVKPIPPSEYQAPCGKGEKHRSSDLCAQWYAADAANRAADWAMWSTIVGALGFTGVLYTLRLTRQATDAAVRTLQKELARDRPFISPVVSCGTLSVAYVNAIPNYTPSITYSLRNFGSAPAIIKHADGRAFGGTQDSVEDITWWLVRDATAGSRLQKGTLMQGDETESFEGWIINPVKQGEVPAYFEGTKAIWFVCIARYIDFLGTERNLTAKYRYVQGLNQLILISHEETETEKPIKKNRHSLSSLWRGMHRKRGRLNRDAVHP
jgi:hypothetical protein